MLTGFVTLIAVCSGIDGIVAIATGRTAGILIGSLGAISTIGGMTVGLLLTAVPLVEQRRSGVLRHLGMTPARVALFLLGDAPIRIVVLGFECLTTLLIVLIHSNWRLDTAGPLTISLVLASAMALSLGYLIASRTENADVVRMAAYVLPFIALLGGGMVIPIAALPSPIREISLALPTTWFIATIDAQIRGTAPPLSPQLAWGLMALATLLSTGAAFRLFRWTSGAH